MITINGRKFARNESELVSSLFDPSGTGSGFYRPIRGGIQLYNLQNELFALAVNNKYDEQFFVSASTHNGKPFYLYDLTDKDRQFLGFDTLSYSAERDIARSLFEAQS